MEGKHPETDVVRRSEMARLRALVTRDLAAAAALHADDYELVPPGGTNLSKEDYLGGVASGDLDYTVFEPASEIAVRGYGDAAVIRYRARTEMTFSGQADGGEFWHTDFYERRTDGWQVVRSQATRIRR